MKKVLFILLLVALASMAFSPGYGREKPASPACLDCGLAWTIVDKFNSIDRGWVYTLQMTDDGVVYTKYALPQSGSSKLPSVGQTCTLSGGVFDCGCKYRKLNVWLPVPV